MCGILYAYLNYLTPRTREWILKCLITGLERLEYRGYDSAGVAIDGGNESGEVNRPLHLVKRQGKVFKLKAATWEGKDLDFNILFEVHCAITHTHWATHGEPNWVNNHPQRSGEDAEFVVVHNGIVTNYKDVKAFLTKKGFIFESETDTETIVKLILHIYDQHKD